MVVEKREVFPIEVPPIEIPPVEVEFPETFPLPSEQITDLKKVEVINLNIDAEKDLQVDVKTMPPIEVPPIEIPPVEVEFPETFPLPAAQVADLKKTEVVNLPATYPLPAGQVTELKSVSVVSTVNPPALDVSLSTRASETTLAGIKTGTDRLDVALSTRASETTLTGIRDRLPLSLTTVGNFKVSLEESGILVPVDLQAVFKRLHTSTFTPLGANGVFISSPEDALNFTKIKGSCFSNVSGTLNIEFSPDNLNWDAVTVIPYTGGEKLGFIVEIPARYVRIRYVNGATAQTEFRLYAWLSVM